MFTRVLQILFVLLMFPYGVYASSFVAAGKKIVMQGNGKGATACVACHGADGAGNEAAKFPRLSGLDPAYLAKQLHDFASGARANATMMPIAKVLTTKEIKQVTQYYSGVRGHAKPEREDTTELSAGKKLVTVGNWSKNIPACVQCHGAEARGIGSHFPALAGQYASYIVAQLEAWKKGTRKNDPNGLMKAVAMRLSAAEIQKVAAYLSHLKPFGQ